MSGVSANSVRSWPTQKPRPAPVRTTARISGSCASARAARRPEWTDASSAFSLSGRLSVIVKTAPSRLVSTESAMRRTLLQALPDELRERGLRQLEPRLPQLEPRPRQLEPRLRPPEHRPERQDRRERDELTHDRDLRRVDSRLPADAVALDDPRPCGAGRQAEAAAAVALGVAAASAAARNLGRRNHGHAVLLVRLAVHALRGHGVLSAAEYLLHVHRVLLSLVGPWWQTTPPYRSREATPPDIRSLRSAHGGADVRLGRGGGARRIFADGERRGRPARAVGGQRAAGLPRGG